MHNRNIIDIAGILIKLIKYVTSFSHKNRNFIQVYFLTIVMKISYLARKRRMYRRRSESKRREGKEERWEERESEIKSQSDSLEWSCCLVPREVMNERSLVRGKAKKL
jgi:hypothetical protein